MIRSAYPTGVEILGRAAPGFNTILTPAALERLCGLLESLGLSLYHPALTAESGGKLAVLAGLQEFREHLGGEPSCHPHLFDIFGGLDPDGHGTASVTARAAATPR